MCTATKRTCTPLLVQADVGKATHRSLPAGWDPQYFLPVEKVHASSALRFLANGRQRFRLRAKQLFSLAMSGRFRQDGYKGTDLLQQLKNNASTPKAWSAIAMGTPGPYNKQSVLLMDNHGKAVSLSKICCRKACRHLLENESGWLQCLSGFADLRPHVPRLVYSGEIGDLLVVTQSVQSGTFSGRKPKPAHLSFLGKLQKTCEPATGFIGSKMHNNMISRMTAMESSLTVEWQQRSGRAITVLEEVFTGNELPMVVTHRDFTPWNIRTGISGIYVFDWEYASSEYIPLYDLYHFLLIPVVLKGKLHTADMRKFISTTTMLGKQLPEGNAKTRYPEAQLLAYLLDLCLFYLESQGGKSEGDRVVSSYAHLIDTYSEWRTA